LQVATKLASTADQFLQGAPQQTTDTSIAARTATAVQEAAPSRITAQTVAPSLVGTAAQATAAQDTAGAAQATAAQQDGLSQEATAATSQLPPDFLMSGQLTQLLQTENPEDIPAFARPAVAAVDRMLAARGLTRTSIGAEQLTNTLIQSALPMAQANSQALQANFEANLGRQQQVSMLNAQLGTQLDLANLNNRQQTALFNTSQIATLRQANVSNQQQANILNSQMRQQALLSDQSSENAAAQFNASSQAQTDQFMSSITQQVQQRNADRITATAQFNAGQENTLEQFSTQLAFNRDQFNTQNAMIVEQSNVAWRRDMNKIDTQAINAVNQANAMNTFNMSNQALTFMWQEMRDAAKWTFEASQNDKQRAASLAQAALSNEAATDASKVSQFTALGSAALNLWADAIN
jgi:hypothetical protein